MLNLFYVPYQCNMSTGYIPHNWFFKSVYFGNCHLRIIRFCEIWDTPYSAKMNHKLAFPASKTAIRKLNIAVRK